MIRGAIHRLNLLRSRLPIYLPYRFRPVSGERYFCQNSGSCGSKYIVELFEADGLGPSELGYGVEIEGSYTEDREQRTP